MGDGKDLITQTQNQEILKKDNEQFIGAMSDHPDAIEEKTSLTQDKETTAKLYECAKQWSISCGVKTLNNHKTLSSLQDQAYARGYEKAIDNAIKDVKNMPESVQQAYKLLKEDPKAFGIAMVQALKELPAEYKDKLEKITNAKLKATTQAEFERAGKAEAELKIEFAGIGVGGAGIAKTGAKVVEKTAKAINDLRKAQEIKKIEQEALKKQKIDNNASKDDFQQYDHYREDNAKHHKTGEALKGGNWDWKKQAPNDGAVEGSARVDTMQKGQILDRFGLENGSYMAPNNVPLEQRSLPPGKNRPGDLHEYVVDRPFKALIEDISPAFGQPGGGTQIRAKIPEIQDGFANIEQLKKFEYLKDRK